MIGFIKDPRTLETEAQLEIISYRLPIDSAPTESGTITAIAIEGDYSNHIIEIPELEKMFVLGSQSEGDNNIINLTCFPFEYIFNIASTLDQYFTGISDLIGTLIGVSRNGYYYSNDWFTLKYVNAPSKLMPSKIILTELGGINHENFFNQAGSEYLYTLETCVGIYLYNIGNRFNQLIDDTLVLGENKCYYVNGQNLINKLKLNGVDIRFKIGPYYSAEYRVGSYRVRVDDIIKYVFDNSLYRVTSIDNFGRIRMTVDREHSIEDARWINFSSNQYETDTDNLAYKGSNCNKQNIYLDGKALYCSIKKSDFDLNEYYVVYFEDGHSSVISINEDDSEIITHIRISSAHFDQQHIDLRADIFDYYLKSDGTISENISDQADGASLYETADPTTAQKTWNDYLETAQEKFVSNTSDSKVEFVSDKLLHYGQPVRLMLKKETLDTVISKVEIKSGDDRYYYTCGDIPTSVSDRLNTYNWRYGQRLPRTAKKGQLYII